MMTRPKGWKHEPARHALAAKGIKSGTATPPITVKTPATTKTDEQRLEELQSQFDIASAEWNESAEMKKADREYNELDKQTEKLNDEIDRLEKQGVRTTTDGEHPYYSRDSYSGNIETNISSEFFEAMRKADIKKSTLRQSDIVAMANVVWQKEIARAKKKNSEKLRELRRKEDKLDTRKEKLFSFTISSSPKMQQLRLEIDKIKYEAESRKPRKEPAKERFLLARHHATSEAALSKIELHLGLKKKRR